MSVSNMHVLKHEVVFMLEHMHEDLMVSLDIMLASLSGGAHIEAISQEVTANGVDHWQNNTLRFEHQLGRLLCCRPTTDRWLVIRVCI